MAIGRAESEKLSKWIAEINIARTIRESYLRNWNYYEQMYDDNLWGLTTGRFESGRRRSKISTSDLIPQINIIQPIIESVLAKVHVFSPAFQVQSVYNDPRMRFSALAWESYADILYELLDMDSSSEEIIIDGLLLGSGVSKIGYAGDFDSPAYTLGDSSIKEPAIFDENVFMEDVEIQNLLIDFRAKHWEDKRWIAEEITKPVDEVKDNDLYSNTKDLQPTIHPSKEIAGVARKDINSADKSRDLVRLVEIHDLKEGKIITIADGHQRILREDDDYGYDVYKILTFTNSRPRRVWGKSVTQGVEEHSVSLSKIYYHLLSHSKRGGTSKVLVEASAVTPEAIKQLESVKDFEVIPVDGLTSSSMPVQELKMSGPSSDFYVNFQLVDSMIRQVSGVTQQERGKHEPGVRTAFEAGLLEEGSDDRNNRRIKKLNEFAASVMSNILRIASDNIPVAKIAAAIGLPMEFANMITPFDQLSLKVKFGSTAAQAQQQKWNRVISFAQLATQLGLQVNPQTVMEMMSDALGLELWEKNLLIAGAPAGNQPGAPAPANLSGGDNASLSV
jgi:hypothetical protein